uniref:Uncharacterized protein n=1 Tax=Tanacetum cinerariifolium TaxID=118510 RepID=A0A699GJU5_TANCI|nr:hypothetical protein [Tanacetum cinerariifolium]
MDRQCQHGGAGAQAHRLYLWSVAGPVRVRPADPARRARPLGAVGGAGRARHLLPGGCQPGGAVCALPHGPGAAGAQRPAGVGGAAADLRAPPGGASRARYVIIIVNTQYNPAITWSLDGPFTVFLSSPRLRLFLAPARRRPPHGSQSAVPGAADRAGRGHLCRRFQAAGAQDHAGAGPEGRAGRAVQRQSARRAAHRRAGRRNAAHAAAARCAQGARRRRPRPGHRRRRAAHRRDAGRRSGHAARGGVGRRPLQGVGQEGRGVGRQLRPAPVPGGGARQRGVSAPDGQRDDRRVRALSQLLPRCAGQGGRHRQPDAGGYL